MRYDRYSNQQLIQYLESHAPISRFFIVYFGVKHFNDALMCFADEQGVIWNHMESRDDVAFAAVQYLDSIGVPAFNNAEDKKYFCDLIASGQTPEKRYGFYNESEIIENLKELSTLDSFFIDCTDASKHPRLAYIDELGDAIYAETGSDYIFPYIAYLKDNGAPVFYKQDDVDSFQLMKIERL